METNVGVFSGLLGGKSLEATLGKARKLLSAGDFDESLKVVTQGLVRFPEAAVLREVGHAVRRAQARAGMQALVARVDQDGDPESFEELIALYRDVGMSAERLHLTERYVREHPDLETPHLLRGEQALETFFEDLRAVDGRVAIDHLVKAATINPDSLKARMLLSEIYFAIGSDRALLGQAAAIERLAGEDEVVRPVLASMREAAKPSTSESVDALLAKVEVAAAIVRDPSTWSSRPRRGIAGGPDAGRLTRNLARLVKEEVAEEAVAIDRSGAQLASAGHHPLPSASPKDAVEGEAPPPEPESALAGVARAVARTVKVQARELELGAFRRCVVEGPFGVMVVVDAAGGVVAAKGRRGTDPHRLAERLSVAAEGGRGRKAS